MTSKVFKTAFEIHAKYFGKAAIANASRDMGKVDKAAKLASSNVRGYFTAIRVGLAGVAGYAGYKALRGIFDIGGKALDAAKDVRKATDQVRQNYGLLVKEGRLNESQLERVTKEAFELAESLHGIDAEDMAQTLSKLSKWLSDTQIKALAKGYQDYLVTINRGIPTLEQMATAEQKIQSWVKGGKGTILKELGWTQDQIASYKKKQKGLSDVEKESQRAATITKALGKETGAMARFWQTDAGAVYKAEQAEEAFNETAGKSAAAIIPELNRSMAELWDAMQPVAKMMDKDMGEAVKNLSKWISENKDKIAAWGKGIIDWTKWAWDSFWWLQQKSENLFKPIAENSVKEFNNILKGMQAAWDGIAKIWDAAAGYFSSIVDAISKAFIPLYNAIIKPFVDAYNYVAKLFPGSGGGTVAPPSYSGGARQDEDYVPEWQDKAEVQGLNQPGTNIPFPYTPTASTKVSNAGLAKIRAPFAQELATDPEAKGRFFAKTKAEVGSQGFDAIQKQMENMQNRAWLRNLTAKQVATQGGKAGRYWGSGYKRLTPEEQKVYELALAGVHAGSNQANLATGNESANVRNGQVVSRAKGGERFVIEPADVAKHKRLRDAASGRPTSLRSNVRGKDERITSLRSNLRGINMKGRTEGVSPTSIAMNPTINFNGSTTASPQAIAEKVAGVMRMTGKEYLKIARKGRSEDLRSGYV